MSKKGTTHLPEDLGEGLLLRTVQNELDAERFVALNRLVNGEGEAAMCSRLLHHRPGSSLSHFLLVIDQHTGEAVSTTCLLPWRCHLADITLNVAMLEMVTTHPDYRQRGLVRAQVRHYHESVRAGGYDLSVVQGIPYYYRQFGYAYAIDHQGCDSLPAWLIPAVPPGEALRYRLRPARPEDVPALTGLYEQTTESLQFAALRGPEYWHYLLRSAQLPVHIVEDARDGHAAGYMSISRSEDGRTVTVGESAIPRHDVALGSLCAFKAGGCREVRISWPAGGALVQTARSLGSVPQSAYQWLVRITEVASFLSAIGPALESRAAGSDCAGLTADLLINLYRQAFRLHFQAGRLATVEPVGFVDSSMGADGGELCIPPEAFVRLALGYRGLDELRDAWPDIIVRRQKRHVLDVLFPRLDSCLLMPY